MGTRTLLHIKEKGMESPTLVTIYRQYDGYPDGLGLDILKAINMGDCKIVNGYMLGDEIPQAFNTMGCLAAHIIGQLKTKIGNVYIYPTDSKNCNEEFTYYLCNENGKPHLYVRHEYPDPDNQEDSNKYELYEHNCVTRIC